MLWLLHGSAEYSLLSTAENLGFACMKMRESRQLLRTWIPAAACWQRLRCISNFQDIGSAPASSLAAGAAAALAVAADATTRWVTRPRWERRLMMRLCVCVCVEEIAWFFEKGGKKIGHP